MDPCNLVHQGILEKTVKRNENCKVNFRNVEIKY